MDVRTEHMYFSTSTSVSSIDGIPYKTMPAAVNNSASLGLFVDFLFRMMNRIDSASAFIVSGGSAGSVAIGLPAASYIHGRVHGHAFALTNAGFSGQPGSAVSTNSAEIRKVGVALKLSSFSPGHTDFSPTGGTVQFVYGPAFKVPGSTVVSGGMSAYFNQVALPKWSADQIPLGILNIPASFSQSAGIANHMFETDARQWAGINLSLVMVGIA